MLMGAGALALVVANSPFATAYFSALHFPLGPLSVQHWINDALMVLFFLLVGLEIKRELRDGELATWSRRILPGVSAAGGMLVPAVIFLAFNHGNPATLRGWAIPTATDIAFALGVVSLLGSRVPLSLKVFLTALAIIDDLGAVLIIALVYTGELSLPYIVLAALVAAILLALNLKGISRLSVYLVLGCILWFFVLRSGVHATVAGVVLAFMIPLGAEPKSLRSPLHRLEHGLQPCVSFIVVPLFGLANAGVSFAGVNADSLSNSLTLGIVLGLSVGKLIGVYGSSWLMTRLGYAGMPEGASKLQLLGVSMLCGIGFTMSLFIGILAFPNDPILEEAKIGILGGSLLAGSVGWALLRRTPACRCLR